jgi:uncharacterized membrane protein
MQINLKSLLFGFSVFINILFFALLISAAFVKTSKLDFSAPEGFVTAAAIVSIPSSAQASFELVEIVLKPGEKAYLQFAFYALKRQGNMLITPLYDPQIISVSQTGQSMEIKALKDGHALIQMLTNEGIRDVAFITVTEQ